MFNNLFQGAKSAAPAAQPQQPAVNVPQQPVTNAMQGKEAIPGQKPSDSNTPLQNQQAQGNPTQPPSDPNAAQGAITDPAGQAPANPLDALDALWNTPEPAEGDPNAPAPTEQPNFLQVDPSQLGEVTKSMPLSSALPQELKTRIESGDTAAMFEAIDFVGKQVYAQAMQHSTHLVGKQLETNQTAQQAATDKQLQNAVNTTLTQQAIKDSPYAHPLLQRELSRVSEMVQAQYPDASPQWIAQQAQEYMKQVAGAFNGGANDPTNVPASNPEDINWDEWAQH